MLIVSLIECQNWVVRSGAKALVSIGDPHGLRAGEENHVFCYGKKRWAGKSNCVVCQLPFFEPKMLAWGLEQTLFSNDIAPVEQNGSWKPCLCCQQPLLSLHLTGVFGSHFLLLVCSWLVSSQPAQSLKEPFSLTCLGCTTIKLEKKERKQKMNRKDDFSSQHIIGIHVDYISYSQKV